MFLLHGALQPNATKFPNGMRPLADYLATLGGGIGLGVYTDHGNGSCGTGPGSWGHYDLDAQTFADWRVPEGRLLRGP